MPRQSLITQLRQLEQIKQQFLSAEKCGTITEADAACQIDMLNKQQLNIKRKLIYEVHVKNDGTPRRIIEPADNSKGLWSTLLPGKKPLTGKTEEVFLNKLMEYYGLSINSSIIKDVFESALSLKESTENPKKRTIDRIREDFNTYISEDFKCKDIRKIDKDYLREYTQKLVNSIHPTKKAYYSYKGVLNLMFEYALDKDIITTNPVTGIKNTVYFKSCDTTPTSCEDKIFSAEEIQLIKNTIEKRMTYKRYKGYFNAGYAILFAIETGCRIAELCSLKWSDVGDRFIHIHTQLLSEYDEEQRCDKYYLVNYTKNEKGISRGGRFFPLNSEIRIILNRLKKAQDSLGINSEFVFCDINGNWMTTCAYSNVLYRLCKSLGFSITNNHAFRMSLNSNILIGKYHMEVGERAKLLGHTVEVNLKFYTFENKDYLDMAYNIMNGSVNDNDEPNSEVSPWSYQNVIKFRKEKSLEPARFKTLN